MLNELLLITQDIETALNGEDTERLSILLASRRETAARLDIQECASEGAQTLLRRIRECEDRCLAVARTQAERVQAGLLAMQRQRQVNRTYGGAIDGRRQEGGC